MSILEQNTNYFRAYLTLSWWNWLCRISQFKKKTKWYFVVSENDKYNTTRLCLINVNYKNVMKIAYLSIKIINFVFLIKSGTSCYFIGQRKCIFHNCHVGQNTNSFSHFLAPTLTPVCITTALSLLYLIISCDCVVSPSKYICIDICFVFWVFCICV